MATDDKDKRLDPFAEVDDDDWFTAVEKWDVTLSDSLPEDQIPEAAPPADEVSDEGVDPLVQLIDGEMEVDPEGGEALGDLLGNQAAEAIEQEVEIAVGPAEPAEALDFGPDDVLPASTEVEVVASDVADDVIAPDDVASVEVEAEVVTGTAIPDEVQQALSPIEQAHPASTEYDSVADALAGKSDYALEAEPEVQEPEVEDFALEPEVQDPEPEVEDFAPEPEVEDFAPEPEVEEPEVQEPEVEDFAPEPEVEDFVEQPEQQEPEQRPVALTAAADPEPAWTPKPSKATLPPLAIFDEILPSIDDPVPVSVGEVLPSARPLSMDSTGPGLLDGVEEEQEPVDQTLAVPPLPEALFEVDPSAIAIVEATPVVSPSTEDSALFGEAAALQANLVDNTKQAADLQLFAAECAEARGNVEDALGQYQEVLHHRPGYLPALQALWGLHASRKQTSRLVEVVTELGRQLEGTRAGASVLAAAADLQWTQSGDDQAAEETLERCDEDDLRCQLVACDLAFVAGDQQRQQETLEALIRTLQATPLASALWLESARENERAGQHKEAAAAYRKVIEKDPRSLAGHEGLIRCGEQLEDVALLVEGLRGSADMVGTWETARRHQLFLLGVYHQIEGLDPMRELAVAYQEESSLLIDRDWADALARAERYGEAVEVHKELASHLQDPQQKAQALVDAAGMAELAKDNEAALQLYNEAAAIDAGHPVAAEGISRLRLEDPAPERRLEAHQAAALASSGLMRAVHHLQAADILERELSNPKSAAEELMNALEHDPACMAALSRLEPLYRKSDSLEQLAAALDTAAEVQDDPRTASELWQRAATIYELVLDQPEHALTRYRRVLETAIAVEDFPDARLGIQRVLLTLDERKELAQQIEGEVALADGVDAANLWLRRALLLSGDESEEVDESEASLTLALAAAPDYPPAAWQLSTLLGHRGQWERVANIWSSMAEALDEDDPERRALLFRIGAVSEVELEDRVAAASAYSAAAADPCPAPGAIESRQRLDHEDVSAEELEQSLEETGGSLVREATLLSTAGRLRRKGSTSAEALLRRVIDDPEASVVARSMARRDLETLLIEESDWHRLTELLVDDVKVTERRDRIAIHDRIAELDLARHDQMSADLSYASIIELQPDHVASLRYRVGRMLVDRAWSDVGEVLRRQAALVSDPADAAAMWLELARLSILHPDILLPPAAEVAQDESATGEPGSAESADSESAEEISSDSQGSADEAADHAGELNAGALPALMRSLGSGTEETKQPSAPLTTADVLAVVLEHKPASQLALTMLLDMARAEGDTSAIARHLEAIQAVSDSPREKAALMTAAADARGRSIEDYEAAVKADPGCLGAIYELRGEALRTEDLERALRAARAAAAACKVQEHVVDAAALAASLARAGGDLAEAVEHCRRVMEVEPSNRWAFDNLRELLEERQSWAELVELLQQRVDVEPSGIKQVELYSQLASIAKDHLDDPAGAKEHLQAVLELDQENLPALETLAALHEADNEWMECADALLRWARLESDHNVLKNLFARLGAVYQDRILDTPRAIASLQKVTTLDPQDIDALRRLSDLYLEELNFDSALNATVQLSQLERDPHKRVDYQLRIAKIHEDGLRDPHQASLAFRRALELGPANLDAIGALCGFYARQGDQRSMMVHLDSSVANMRNRLAKDPFDAFAYHALFRIFGWRKAPDACFCTARLLEAFDYADDEERAFIESNAGKVGAAASPLGHPENDDWMFQRVIPGGFRHIFQLLADPFGKIRRGELSAVGVSRGDRAPGIHPAQKIASDLSRWMGVPSYRLYISGSASSLLVENTDPPAIVIGTALADGSEEELRFVLGRSLWIISKSMILPTRLRPEDLEILVAAVVRQYVSEFTPEGVDEKALKTMSKQVARVIPRKVKQELMPFALECSGADIDLKALGAAVIHSANRAGLLACRSVHGAITALRKADGHHKTPRDTAQLIEMLSGNSEVYESLKFSVSDDFFDLRRAIQVAIR